MLLGHHLENIIYLPRQPIGRLCTRSESCGKGNAYEYIRGISDNPDRSVIDCYYSEFEK